MKHHGWIRLACAFVICAWMLAMPSLSATAEEQQQDDQSRYLSEADLWRMIIRDSINAYPHLCPCPYSPNRAGKACGDRSGYSRFNNGSLLCYPQDIPDETIARYRERMQ